MVFSIWSFSQMNMPNAPYVFNARKQAKNSFQHLTTFFISSMITKICKKFNSHDGFLRADQDRAINCCQMSWNGYSILQVAQIVIMGIELNVSAISSWKRHEKLLERIFVVFCRSKNILCYRLDSISFFNYGSKF